MNPVKPERSHTRYRAFIDTFLTVSRYRAGDLCALTDFPA
jgi:hypothetical protein